MKTKHTLLCVLLAVPAAPFAVAGVMKPGQWAIETTIESATGPGANKQLPPQPMRTQTCKSQAFVDRENYTSTDFAMRRLQRNQFTCKLDSREGDAKAARWQFSCEREDGVLIVNRAESRVSADRLEQKATEITTVNGELWSDVSVRVDARLTGQDCLPSDTQLN